MRSNRTALNTFAVFSSLGALFVAQSSAFAASPSQRLQAPTYTVRVSDPVVPTVSPALRDLPLAPSGAAPARRTRPRAVRPAPSLSFGPDVALPIAEPESPFDAFKVPQKRTPSPLTVFDGIGSTGYGPPDTVGDVGPNHYVQAVNVAVAIFDKNGNQLVAPHPLGDLWQGGNNSCKTDGGDPVVLYDSLADRWFLSQLAYNPNNPGINGACIAVSKTPDPGGQYNLYFFNTGQELPDYLKFGVWQDAYYMGDNESQYTAYAFDRAKMLAGQAATMQSFAGETNLPMPADLDGQMAPPAGQPGYFYTFKNNQVDNMGGVDRLEVFEFKVDWANPGNSSFNLVDQIPIKPFTYTVCGFFNGNCVPQKGTNQKLDAISEWPMFRLAYRNFGAYETLVGNFTVDDNNANHAAIRWFELRKTGGGAWMLQQEGTHSPDATGRFIGSIAMDKVGNIALGYSASSSSIFADVRYATRNFDDPPGTLQAEVTMKAGGGAQTIDNRWGDYSAMSIDPTDDCTFYYTNEYIPAAGQDWSTVVGKFKMPNCGGKMVGEPCAGASDCKSNFCADGVCCATDCGSDPQDCQACSKAAGAAADGTCSPLAAGVECRAANGGCDAAEKCDGTAVACPADALAAAGTVCRPPAAECDAPETCSGSDAMCPADVIAAAGTVCRAAASSCDVDEVCDGKVNTCPADVTSPDGTRCENGGTCGGGKCDAPLTIDPKDDGGCGCRVPGGDSDDSRGRAATIAALIGLALAGGLRRRARARR